MRRWMFFLSSSFSFGGFLPLGFSWRSSPSASRSILRTDSTSSLISSIRRRFTSSVNSTSRMSCDSTTCARMAAQRALRYLRFSRVVVPLAVSASFSSSFCTTARCLRIASICFSTSLARSSTRSSVISSSWKITSSRMVRVPALSWSPMPMMFFATVGVREIDLMTASLPRSMRRAISTSPSRVSSGTVPISRRYMRTGSLVLSSAPGVRSSSSSSLPSAVRSNCFS